MFLRNNFDKKNVDGIYWSFVAFLKITQCIYIDATVSRLPFKNRFLRLDTHQRHNDHKHNHNHNHKKKILISSGNRVT